MSSRMDENHKINILEQLDGPARYHVAGVVVVGAVGVFGTEQDAVVGL